MKLRVLIAEDEQLERRALSSIITAMQSHEIVLLEASNGRQAIELAKTGSVDMAFLDIRMPGLDGLQTAQELKRIHPELRIIFITAFDHFNYAQEAIRLGVDEYLVKPASPEEIRTTVTRMADRIAAARIESRRKDQPRAMDDQALALLEDELRSDLARGDMVGKRITSFIRLKGLERDLAAAVIVRFASVSPPETGLRHAQLRRVMDFMEHQLRTSGSYILSGTDSKVLRCVVCQSLSVPSGSDAPSALSSLKTALQTLVGAVKNVLGLRIVIGACPFPPQETTGSSSEDFLPFAHAGDAVAIAGTGQSVVIIDTNTTKPEDVNRQGVSTVERAISFMHEHLAEDLSLAEVATAVGTAPSHLSRLFTRYSGDTFIHVLCRLRIDMAKNLLRTNQYRIKEVYTMVGFNDQAYFSRVFKKYEGRSPQDYRALPE